MKRFKEKIGMTLGFAIFIFLINLITTIITAALIFFLFSIRILNENNIQGAMILPIITLVSCLIIGSIVTFFSSRIVLKHVREFMEATNKLSKGDFSVRLDIKEPPEFKLLSENFNTMAEELGGIEVLRTDFINNFSHEFKTPIISIKGFAEILKYDDISSDERKEYLDIIIEESKRLSTLATNVLNLSKIETQSILKESERFNLSEQIRQTILLLEGKLKSRDISLILDIEECYLEGNKEMLNQVWLNLFDNAIKFNSESGIISINVKKNNENVNVMIADTGRGIAKEEIAKVFDKFYQEDSSHATQGNGLGLAIVKKIIQLHNGTIECESIISQGTKFIVTLPLIKS